MSEQKKSSKVDTIVLTPKLTVECVLEELRHQTKAMQQLTEAIGDLADSNREIIDYLASQQDADDPEGQSMTYLDGTRVSLG